MTHLLIKAQSPSEWDDADFFSIEINDAVIKNLDEKINSFKLSENLDSIYAMSFWFLFDAHVIDEKDMDFTKANCLIVDDFNADDYSRPESTLDCHLLYVKEDGFYFRCDGKHTGEEFFTDTIFLESWDEIKREYYNNYSSTPPPHDQHEKALINAMLTYLYKYVENKDLRASTINHIMDNTHYVEALYLGENECSEHETIHNEQNGKFIQFTEAYETLNSSFKNHVL